MDPNKVKEEGAQPPYSPSKEKELSNPVHPEKFKQIMKIEESQETQKRKKRAPPMEEEDSTNEPSSPEPSSFSKYMNDGGPLESIFDKKSAGIRQENIDPSAPLSPSKEERPERVEAQDPSSPLPSLGEKEEETPPSLQNAVPSQNDVQISNKRSLSKTRQKETPPDSSLLASQPKTKNLDSLKRKKRKDAQGEVQTVFKKKLKTPQKPLPPLDETAAKTSSPLLKDKSKKLPQRNKKKQAPLDPLPDHQNFSEKLSKIGAEKSANALKSKGEKKDPLFERLTAEEIRNRAIEKQKIKEEEIEGGAPFLSQKTIANPQKQQKEKKDRTFIEASPKTAGIPLPSSPPFSPPIAPIVAPPSYTNLEPKLFEFFEKISACLIILQEKGVTTTTLNLSTPGSIFHEAQVVISRYNTAPSAYNIQLIGNPKYVQIFSENLEMLKESFREGNFNFEVHLLNPILATEKKSPHRIRRKGKTGKEKDKKED